MKGQVSGRRASTRVFGEEAGTLVAGVLLLLGLATTGATVLLTHEAIAGPKVALPAPTLVTAASVDGAPTATPPAPVARVSDLPPAGRATCAPLVLGFAFGSPVLEGADRLALDRLGRAIASTQATVLVHGHADAHGSDEGNLSLSRARAQAVAGRLVGFGVDRSRITARGFGSYQPVEGTPEEAASNRRVVVYVKGIDVCPIVETGVGP